MRLMLEGGGSSEFGYLIDQFADRSRKQAAEALRARRRPRALPRRPRRRGGVDGAGRRLRPRGARAGARTSASPTWRDCWPRCSASASSASPRRGWPRSLTLRSRTTRRDRHAGGAHQTPLDPKEPCSMSSEPLVRRRRPTVERSSHAAAPPIDRHGAWSSSLVRCVGLGAWFGVRLQSALKAQKQLADERERGGQGGRRAPSGGDDGGARPTVRAEGRDLAARGAVRRHAAAGARGRSRLQGRGAAGAIRVKLGERVQHRPDAGDARRDARPRRRSRRRAAQVRAAEAQLALAEDRRSARRRWSARARRSAADRRADRAAARAGGGAARRRRARSWRWRRRR